MSTLSVDSSINLGDLFGQFFIVADFQRDYVWSDSDVSNLLDDITTARSINAQRQYFIGAVVLAPAPDGGFQVIDGQQRLLTAIVSMAALRQRIKEIDANAPEVQLLTQKLIDFQLTDTKTVERLRIVPAFEGGEAALRAIFEDREPSTPNEACERLWDAYSTAKGHFAERATSLPEARGIAYFLLSQVALLPYVAVDQQQALTVFETLNSRGQRLSALDLIKSVAFANTAATEWEELKKGWGALSEELERTGETPKRLLRYFLLVEHGERVAENAVYDWIRANQPRVGLKPDPSQFVNGFSAFLTAYSHVKEGALPDGRANPICRNIRRLTGSGRQYFPAVLALRHVTSVAAVDRALHAIESFIVAYAVQRRYTGRIESTFTNWALGLRDIRSDDELTSYLDGTVEPEVKAAGKDAITVLRVLHEGTLANQKITYLLLRLDSFLQVKANGTGSTYRNLDNYSGFDREHIQPLASAANLSNPGLVRRLGNLTILEKPLNRAVKDKDFHTKATIAFNASQYHLTKAMVTSLPGASTTAQTFGLVKSFQAWGESEIAQRNENLVELCCAAFNWDYEPPLQDIAATS